MKQENSFNTVGGLAEFFDSAYIPRMFGPKLQEDVSLCHMFAVTKSACTLKGRFHRVRLFSAVFVMTVSHFTLHVVRSTGPTNTMEEVRACHSLTHPGLSLGW